MDIAKKEGKSTKVIRLAKAIMEITTETYSSTNEEIRMEKGQDIAIPIKEKGSSSSLVPDSYGLSFPTLKTNEKWRFDIFYKALDDEKRRFDSTFNTHTIREMLTIYIIQLLKLLKLLKLKEEKTYKNLSLMKS